MRFFASGGSARTLVANTVPRGYLREDELLYTGKVSGQFANMFPMPVTADVMARGQERYNVFCSPCHGRTGVGNGMIVQRGFRQPPSFGEQRLRDAPAGYFFDVMTNGFGAMQDYAAQVPVADRWAIAAYIRALAAQSERHGGRRSGRPPFGSRSTRAGEPVNVDTTYSPPVADIDRSGRAR